MDAKFKFLDYLISLHHINKKHQHQHINRLWRNSERSHSQSQMHRRYENHKFWGFWPLFPQFPTFSPKKWSKNNIIFEQLFCWICGEKCVSNRSSRLSEQIIAIFPHLGFDHRIDTKIRGLQKLTRNATEIRHQICVQKIKAINWDLGFAICMHAKFGDLKINFQKRV